MSRSSFSLMGCLVLATASIAVTTSGLSTAGAFAAQSGKTADNQTVQQLLAQSSTSEATPEASQLPAAVRNAILKDVSGRTQKQISQFQIVRVSPQTWPDGCLGMGGAGVSCTEATVPGWAVLVASGKQYWVYRADQSGSVVKWDEDASKTVAALRTTETTTQRRLGNRTTQQAAASRTNSTQQTAASRTTTSRTNSTQQTSASRTTSAQQVATTQTSSTSFKDISKNYWAKNFITELAEKKIILGYPDGTYRPDELVTRAEFAAMISLAFQNNNKSRQPLNFKDVQPSEWTHSYILDAYQMGFLDVDAVNNFNPGENISRLDVLVALAKGLGYTATGSTNQLLSVYKDADAIPTQLRTFIAAATEKGIVVSYPNVKLLNPKKQATRAEVAAILYQAMAHNGQTTSLSSPYVVGTESRNVETREAETVKTRRRNCNQGIGNGAEGCDPGNSRPHGGSNDEGGRTPGNRIAPK